MTHAYNQAIAMDIICKTKEKYAERKKHKDAADELWDVREAYLSLITDFCDLSLNDIRSRRDEIQRI